MAITKRIAKSAASFGLGCRISSARAASRPTSANLSSYDGRKATDLLGADMTGATATGVYFNGARGLEGVTLVNARLAYADLSGTALTLTVLDQDVPRLSGLNACGATVLYPQYRQYSLYPIGSIRCPLYQPQPTQAL